MTLDNTAADYFSLELAKQHLNVSNNLDDTLIQSYIDSSKGIVEDYLHAKTLESSYMASSEELIEVNGDLILYLTEKPYLIEITSNLGTETLEKRAYSYTGTYLVIPGVDGRDITAVTAKTGKVLQQVQILQARLLLVGSAYAYRENSIPLRMSEMPDGVRFILDNCSDASL